MLLLHASYSVWEGRGVGVTGAVRMEKGAGFGLPVDAVVEAVLGYVAAVVGVVLKYGGEF